MMKRFCDPGDSSKFLISENENIYLEENENKIFFSLW